MSSFLKPRSMVIAVVLGLLVGAGCKKSNDTSAKESPKTQEAKQPATPATKDTPAAGAKGDVTATVGVQAGGLQHSDTEGPAAVLAKANGTVEVRRVGEPSYAAAKQDTKLYPGDVVRTGDGAAATLTLADQSTVELAETTSLAIASRDGTADPASAAAVLEGMARFSVTPRAPAEGPFRVYTPAGVIVTRGTTYGVGVAASGEARVGVENGTVEVIGLSKMDAAPVAVEKSTQVVLAADGTVGTPAPWATDDWGTWRDDTEAKVQVAAAVDAHGKAMTDLNQQLVDGYAQLQASADQAATFEATAATSAEKPDQAAYQAALPDGAATIDASFALGARLEALTWAYASHAELATDLYIRHPKDVEASWQVVAPQIDAAVLWPKRYDVTATAYLEPLRTQYYIHHPRGRTHAALVGIAVPEFYAKVEPPAIDPTAVRAKVQGAVWIAPEMTYHASTRPVWIAMPDASWSASVKATPAPARAKVAWYVRPPTLKATALVAVPVTGNWTSKLTIGPAQPVADLTAMWKVPVGTKIHIAAPDMSAAATARAKVKLGADGRIVRDHRMAAAGDIKGDVKANVKADVKGKVDVQVPAVQVPDVKAGVAVKVRDHRDAAAAAGADAAAKVNGAVKATATVKAPEVKVQAPSVKVEGHAKAGFKIGH